MSKSTAELVSFPDAELVFGVVAPAGTNRGDFLGRFTVLLGAYNYSTRSVHLSDLIGHIAFSEGTDPGEGAGNAARRERLMTEGSKLRRDTAQDGIVALLGIADIQNARKQTDQGSCALPRTAHVLWSLKHPDEVSLLQQVYGASFFLIGLFSSEEDRIQNLIAEEEMSREEAERIVNRDSDERLEYGQKTRDTFQLADVFIPMDKDADRHIQRFLDLVFGNPATTPTADEHAMFLAYAGAQRSGALARQVGAVVVTEDGDVVAVGANDAPRFGGGPYWPGEDDQRDVVKGRDANAVEQRKIAQTLVDQLKEAGLLANREGDAKKALEVLEKGRLGDITEYGRDVHAEMHALLGCARSGVSVRGATLYTTTFPCHNCAKHLIAAGFRKVVFVEPYPKSKALELHGDAMTLNGESDTDHLYLQPFIGVGPRRYFDLFSLKLGQGGPRRRKEGDKLVEWTRETASPRLQIKPLSYLQCEQAAQKILRGILSR